jgi:hypothetical protein
MNDFLSYSLCMDVQPLGFEMIDICPEVGLVLPAFCPTLGSETMVMFGNGFIKVSNTKISNVTKPGGERDN